MFLQVRICTPQVLKKQTKMNYVSDHSFNVLSGGGDDSDYLLEFSEFPKFLTTGVDAARISDQFVDVSIVCSDSGKICGIKCLDHGIK